MRIAAVPYIYFPLRPPCPEILLLAISTISKTTTSQEQKSFFSDKAILKISQINIV